MFDEPDVNPEDRPSDPAERAKTKSDEFRMHAELAAVFEGNRKFDARILKDLDPGVARECRSTASRRQCEAGCRQPYNRCRQSAAGS